MVIYLIVVEINTVLSDMGIEIPIIPQRKTNEPSLIPRPPIVIGIMETMVVVQIIINNQIKSGAVLKPRKRA